MHKTLNSADIDKQFVGELIATHGPVQAITIIEKCFGCDMNESITDAHLRLMVWQIIHSLGVLRNQPNITFSDIPSIERISDTTDKNSTRTIANHIRLAFDKIVEYIAEP
jgi:hypothetical protein